MHGLGATPARARLAVARLAVARSASALGALVLVALVLLALALAACGCGAAGRAARGTDPKPLPGGVPKAVHAPAGPPPIPRGPGFLVAAVEASVQLRASPGGPVVASVGTRTEFGSARVLSIVRQRGNWFGVVVTERPDGELAWIANNSHLELFRVRYELIVLLGRHELELVHNGHLELVTPVAVGAPSTPTPPGLYAVTDRLIFERPADYGYGALALTGHQPHIAQGWGGGDRLAIHGTNDPGSVGEAVSHGCLRAGAGAIRRLVNEVPLGTPVLARA